MLERFSRRLHLVEQCSFQYVMHQKMTGRGLRHKPSLLFGLCKNNGISLAFFQKNFPHLKTEFRSSFAY